MKKIIEINLNGIHSAPIDISSDEWKSMLTNKSIFNEPSLNMIIDWYNQPLHQATCKDIMKKNHNTGNNPYNGIVTGLGKRVIKHLDRFEVYNTQGSKKTYYLIPFIGWHIDKDPKKDFVWKIRDELITTIGELNLVNPNKTINIQNYSIESSPEGNKIAFISNRYERSVKNRKEAIKLHGTTCSICGFNFEKVYGEHGKGFIEVHHIHPLSEQNQKVNVNPQTDMICVCANCHRMIHRNKDKALSPEELKNIIKIKAKK